MGVPLLWSELINKTGKPRSLANLAVVEGFEGNASGKRGYRIGVDASIWFHHVKDVPAGENPETRTLFFRLCSMSKLPITLLFVFDGPQRSVKRGSRMGKTGSHFLTGNFKNMLSGFGMEWRMAPGEAEAELAWLNQTGVIDAVLTDDVDALVFGALTVIKNSSLKLSGNKANKSKLKEPIPKGHVEIYTAKDIYEHPAVAMTRAGLILIALMSGGDYDKGIKGIGILTAHAVARCGFGDELVRAFEKKQDDQEFQRFLVGWRARVNLELQTNSRDMLSKALPRFSLPADFPDINVLQAYIKPIRSEGGDGGRPLRHKDTLSIPKLVAFCEAKFEDWGSSSAVLKRFLKLIQGPAIMQVLRGAALVADAQEKIRREALGIHDLVIREPLKPSRADSVETPPTLVKKFLSGGVAPSAADEYRDVFVNQGASQPRARAVAPDPHPLIEKIIGERRDISTGELLEYKVNICPSHLVTLAKQGIKWTRPDGPTASIDNSGLHSAVWMWIPASIFHQVHPGLVEDYTIMEEAKKNKKTRSKGKGKARETQYDSDDVDVPTKGVTPPPKTKRKYIKKAPPAPGQRADGNSSPSRVPQPSAVGRKRQVFSTAGDASHPQTESSVSPNPVHSSHPSDRDAGLQVRGHAPSGQNSIVLALADALNDDIKVLTVPKQKQNKTRTRSSQS